MLVGTFIMARTRSGPTVTSVPMITSAPDQRGEVTARASPAESGVAEYWHLRDRKLASMRPASSRSRSASRALCSGGRPERAIFGALIGALSVAGLSVFVWWEGALRYGSSDSRWSVSAVIAVVVSAAVLIGVDRQRLPSRRWLASVTPTTVRHERRSPTYSAGVAAWIVLLTMIFAWDLVSFLSQSHDLPTMSYLIGRITRDHLGRSALFLVWLATGSYLAFGWRRARDS